ncbi:MAG: hypothetical protein J5637_01485 [Prevotella sp.]|nr:hypothetical protein [Prevotella sp.]
MRRGRAVCETLKDVRRKIAQANDISYSPNVCHHEGDCAGTCAACEKEMRYLEHQLRLRRLAGKTVRVAGVSLGMVAILGSCFKTSEYTAGRVPYDDRTSQTVSTQKADSVGLGTATAQPETPLRPIDK